MVKTPTAQQLAYMATHHDDTLVAGIIACCSVCGIVSIIVIMLRFWSRKIVHGRVKAHASDWLLLIAWVGFPSLSPVSDTLANPLVQVFYAVFDVCFAMTTMYGAGRHIIYITNARMLQIVRTNILPGQRLLSFSLSEWHRPQ